MKKREAYRQSLIMVIIGAGLSGCTVLPFFSADDFPADEKPSDARDFDDLVSGDSVSVPVQDFVAEPEQSRDRKALLIRPSPAPESGELVQNPASAPGLLPTPEARTDRVGPVVDQAKAAVSVAGRAAQQDNFLDLADASVVFLNLRSRETLRGERTNQTQNVLALRRSNYEHLLIGTGLVDEKVLTFTEDSARLSPVSSARIQVLVSQFNADTDLFSVVGCSLGRVDHPHGPEDLARARAEVVRDALLRAGVQDESILEEACWSEETLDMRMPRHGVVIALARRVT